MARAMKVLEQLEVRPFQQQKQTSRKGAKTQRIRKVFQVPKKDKWDFIRAFLCDIFASSRLCVRFGFLGVVLLTTVASAQQIGSIGGRVLDAKTGEPLPGVNVAVQGTTFGAATNENGLFVIKNLPIGAYTLNASMIGYAPGVRSGVKVAVDGTTPVVIRLAETLIEVPTTIVTASKRAQSFMETPASVSVINSRQIAQQNFVTLDKALEFVPGVNLVSGQLNIRGSSGYSRGAGSRVLLLVDGIPMMPGDSGDIKWDALPTGEVDHVEIVKGSASALYGSSAMGGVVNVIYRDPGETPKTTVKLTGGVYDSPYYDEWKWTDRTLSYNQQDISHERSFGKLKMRTALGRRESTGFSQNGQFKRYSIYTKLKYLFSPTSNLMLYGNYADDDHGSLVLWQDFNSPLEVAPERSGDTIFSSKLQTGGTLTTVLNTRINMKLRGSYFRNRFEDRYIDNKDRNKSHNFESDLQFDLDLGQGHATTVGVTGSSYNIRATIFGAHEIRNFSDYGQHEWKISDRVTATGGARFDYFWVDTGLREWQTTPRLGLVYLPVPELSLRISAGGGFRSPAGAEMFTSTTLQGFKVVPNFDLKSEKSGSYEIGGNYIFRSSRLNVAAFWNDYDDFIEGNFVELNGETVIQFNNVSRARIRGFEVEVENSLWRQRISLHTGYTYLDTRDLTTKKELQYRPRHLLTVNGSLTLSRYTLGLDFRHVSRIEEVAIYPDDPRVSQRVLNARLSANLKPVTLTLNVYNTLQWNYTQVERNLEPIRSVALTGSLDF
jgi:iron complex outermembrane receptor protein